MASAEGMRAHEIGMRFGGVKALDGAGVEFASGPWLGLIGPNGSGKSTLLNVLSGVYLPTGGSVSFAGRDITRISPRRRAMLGIVRTFQHPQFAHSLTLAENVASGATLGLRRMGQSRRRDAAMGRARAALEAFGCADYADSLANEAPYGVRKIAEVARAAAAHPTVLLLDEPAAGLSAEERVELVEALRGFAGRHPDTAVCLVEHDVALVRSLCDRLAVLNAGRVLHSGQTEAVLQNDAVRSAYLGQADPIVEQAG